MRDDIIAASRRSSRIYDRSRQFRRGRRGPEIKSLRMSMAFKGSPSLTFSPHVAPFPPPGHVETDNDRPVIPAESARSLKRARVRSTRARVNVRRERKRGTGRTGSERVPGPDPTIFAAPTWKFIRINDYGDQTSPGSEHVFGRNSVRRTTRTSRALANDLRLYSRPNVISARACVCSCTPVLHLHPLG